MDEDKLNVSGGAIALGHPFGMTGARITATLLNNLATYDKTFGIESMCVGGGQGMAMVLERLSASLLPLRQHSGVTSVRVVIAVSAVSTRLHARPLG